MLNKLLNQPYMYKYKSQLWTIVFLMIAGNLAAQVTDKEGNNYTSVKIGKQEWLADNLNTSHFRNGDSIPEAETAAAWQQAANAGKPAWCYYDGDSASGRKYHKLYNWYAVMDSRGLAPDGWHIPSSTEWAMLTANLGGENRAGTKMKVSNGWDGTNESGFAALPGGYRNSGDVFSHKDNIGSWWTATETNALNAWSNALGNGSGIVNKSYDDKRAGMSVRCIKN